MNCLDPSTNNEMENTLYGRLVEAVLKIIDDFVTPFLDKDGSYDLGGVDLDIEMGNTYDEECFPESCKAVCIARDDDEDEDGLFVRYECQGEEEEEYLKHLSLRDLGEIAKVLQESVKN